MTDSGKSRTSEKKSSGIAFFAVVFVVIAIASIVFRNQQRIEWTLDYAAGIQKSQQTDKPALIGFHHTNGRFSTEIEKGTWRNTEVVKFVHDNFIPILVNMDSNPEIAREYNASYDSSYFIRLPDGTISPQLTHGDRPSSEFIAKIRDGYEQMRKN